MLNYYGCVLFSICLGILWQGRMCRHDHHQGLSLFYVVNEHKTNDGMREIDISGFFLAIALVTKKEYMEVWFMVDENYTCWMGHITLLGWSSDEF